MFDLATKFKRKESEKRLAGLHERLSRVEAKGPKALASLD